jgi:hypothetical protein
VVNDYLDSVFKHELDQALSHLGGVVHGWGGVDLNQPHIEVVVDHEIETEELEATLFTLKHVLHTLEAVDHDVLRLLFQLVVPDLPTILFLHVSLHLIKAPHVAFNRETNLVHTLSIFGNRVVCEMDKSVSDIVRVIVAGWEPEVGFSIEPHSKWVPIGY